MEAPDWRETNDIPKTLEECFTVLSSFKGVDCFKTFSESKVIQYHHTTGRNIRNEWGFWKPEETPLKKLFFDMGITHPDDMSHMILISFHRHLNGKDIKLEEQVKDIKAYWENEKSNSVFKKVEGSPS